MHETESGYFSGQSEAHEAEARESNEAELVTRAKAGDQEAFGVLFKNYRARAIQFVHKLSADAPAEEIVDEAFTNAARAIGKFEERSSFGTWLLSIVKNGFLSWRRKMKRQEMHGEDSIEVGERAAQEDAVMRGQMRERIEQLMVERPSKEQQMVRMYMAAMSNEEIAKALGTSELNVRVRLHRIRQYLREHLEEFEEDIRNYLREAI